MNFAFISYSREDEAYVNKLTKALREHGIEFWIDLKASYGGSWSPEIQQQIEDCSVFILVMSPSSRQADWVKAELIWARQRKKTIFPISLQGEQWFEVAYVSAHMVAEDELPPLRFFKEIKREISKQSGASTKRKNVKSRKKIYFYVGLATLIILFTGDLWMPATWKKMICNFQGGLWVSKGYFNSGFYLDDRRVGIRSQDCHCDYSDYPSFEDSFRNDLEVDPRNCR
ncbi:toll/interleukin-1 receptor domain-containing protein [Leptolyngbya iicbica]|uniref:Toll/interleukin-1 receptor domain-containing protein n=2 Tax=Cyanophyceae TaxID=3028117 RepID=A0A4Q7EAL2_9CYAN|nr:toll/interleukin-1 receptor domain-containing protein [Leptolyngbya sp. LK]RZM79658.1 toll/interleukin-1 receptor domain-containing protein [Leptolyngbya sp. LK]